MKNVLIFICLIFLISCTKKEDDNVLIEDNSKRPVGITYYQDGIPQIKSAIVYNDNNQIVENILSMSLVEDDWTPYYRMSYAYNSSKVTMTLSRLWNGVWTDQLKYIYETSGSKLISMEDYDLEGDSWILKNRNSFEYSADFLISQTNERRIDGTMELRNKTDYYYENDKISRCDYWERQDGELYIHRHDVFEHKADSFNITLIRNIDSLIWSRYLCKLSNGKIQYSESYVPDLHGGLELDETIEYEYSDVYVSKQIITSGLDKEEVVIEYEDGKSNLYLFVNPHAVVCNDPMAEIFSVIISLDKDSR